MRNEETHQPLKMQKVKRYWLYAGIALVGLGTGMALTTSPVKADVQEEASQAIDGKDISDDARDVQLDKNNLTNGNPTSGNDNNDPDNALDADMDGLDDGTEDDSEKTDDEKVEEAPADGDVPVTPPTDPEDTPVGAADGDTADKEEKSDFTFSQDASGNYTVTGYTGAARQQANGDAPVGGYATAITIPDTYLGKSVIAVGANAFNNDGTSNDHLSIVDKLTAVTLGRNLQWIEAGAFANNALTSLSFAPANNLWSVGENAFANNRLTDVDLNQVAQINTDAFKGNRLTSLVIPEKATNIAAGAFANNSLTQLTLGSNLVTVGTGAFADNQIAGTLVLPANLTQLGDYAFKNNDIQSIVFNAAMKRLTTGVFADNHLTGTLSLPMGLLSVGESAFQNNQLTGIELGDSLETIGDYVFAGNRIGHIRAAGSVKTSIGDEAFSDQSASVAASVETTTTAALGVRVAIKAQLGLTNLDLAGLQFIYGGNGLDYNEYEDTLTLPQDYDDATIALELKTVSTDTGTYGTDGLVLKLVPIIVKADLHIPSTKDGQDWLDNWVADVTGQIGATVTIAVPQLKGYDAQPITVKATVNADGTITTQDHVTYTRLAAPTTGGSHFGGGESLDISGESDVNMPTTGNMPQLGDQQSGPKGAATLPVTETTTTSHLQSPQQTTQVLPLAVRSDRPGMATPASANTVWGMPTSANGESFAQSATGPDGIPTTAMAGKARLPESGGQRASSVNSHSTQVRPVTASTLPQTDDQRSVWQWLGIVLLAGLGWLGLGRRKHQN
ncbi:leucine-rich repeat protein [Levilactobacillus parabrevis]|uniref:Adhesion exoprotein n=1 Tax=Levilactobacillus parabrevis ATCC 53295 TaxID=1267003 RepID=A0A0R1GP09_9LACO|nr:leucine-rich repeat protein [Levilactobacillus parabrevis]KRK35803.1 hypothetical protein FD07_GL001295 [Levilactobacillus parabrevis ATCC 53295]KRO05346.1 hypothetical protein IV61_GL001410 [Levilactobacillus parabrevis]